MGRWIKYVFGIGLLVALTYQLRHRLIGIDFSEIAWSSYGLLWVTTVLILTAVNWSTEAVKSQLTMVAEQLNFIPALKTVLVGLSFAILTPGRIGDYAGRAMHSKDRQQAVMATFLSSAAQLAVTLGFGIFALIMLVSMRDLALTSSSPYWLILPLGLGLVLYFRIEKLVQKLPLFILRKLPRLADFPSLNFNIKAAVLGLSGVRYGVYVIQTILLMWAFELNIPMLDAILGVSILFLVQTIIPMPMLFQVATKIELGLLIWAPFDPGVANLSIVIIVLWCMNVVIPALVGYRIANFNNLVPQKKPSYDVH